MPSRKKKLQFVARHHPAQPSQGNSSQTPTVSARWLLTSLAIVVTAAVLCAWGTLCLLFWQGNWQLLYHPKSTVERTPASFGIPFEPVGFAATETGQLRLQGWWIPAARGALLNRFTILYLHGASGNMGDSLDAVAQLHALGVSVLTFDYRGYGQSQFAHPGESHWLEDADWALEYLTHTRYTNPQSIVLAGSELGADLAVEVAASHPDLAGVILQSPIENPASAIFNDSRAHLIPAHLLVNDRYDLNAAAGQLRIPSLWILPSSEAANAGEPSAYGRIKAPRQLVWLDGGPDSGRKAQDAVSQWLMSLPNR